MALTAKPHEFVIDDHHAPTTSIDLAVVSRLGGRRWLVLGGSLLVVLVLVVVAVTVPLAAPVVRPASRLAAAPPVVAERAESSPAHKAVHHRSASSATWRIRLARVELARTARRYTPSTQSGARAPAPPAVNPPAAAASSVPQPASPPAVVPVAPSSPPRAAVSRASGPGEFF